MELEKKGPEFSNEINRNGDSSDLLVTASSHPLSVCLKITEKCNFNCPHCVSSSSSKSFGGLPISDIKKMLQTLRAHRVPKINFSGGEPFIRKDFMDILEYASELGFETRITSNGSFINKEKAEYLKAKNIPVEISLDGTEDVNDVLRGKGTYRVATRAIKLLKQNHANVTINCTIQKVNYQKLGGIVRLAEDMAVEKIHFIFVRPQGRAKDLDDVCLDSSEREFVYEQIEQFKRETNLSLGLLDLARDAKTFVLIEANGDVVSQGKDEESDLPAGNILRDDFAKMWQNTELFDHIAHYKRYMNH